MLKKIWSFIWEGGPTKGGIKGFFLALPALLVVWVGYKVCMRFDIPSPYAETLMFFLFLAPVLGMTWLSSLLEHRKKSKLSHGPRTHYDYSQFAKHFGSQEVPSDLCRTVYRCLQESMEDSHFAVMPEDPIGLYQDGNGKMDAKSLLRFIQSERLLKKYDLEIPANNELGRAKTVEQVVLLANQYLQPKFEKEKTI